MSVAEHMTSLKQDEPCANQSAPFTGSALLCEKISRSLRSAAEKSAELSTLVKEDSAHLQFALPGANYASAVPSTPLRAAASSKTSLCESEAEEERLNENARRITDCIEQQVDPLTLSTSAAHSRPEIKAELSASQKRVISNLQRIYATTASAQKVRLSESKKSEKSAAASIKATAVLQSKKSRGNKDDASLKKETVPLKHKFCEQLGCEDLLEPEKQNVDPICATSTANEVDLTEAPCTVEPNVEIKEIQQVKEAEVEQVQETEVKEAEVEQVQEAEVKEAHVEQVKETEVQEAEVEQVQETEVKEAEVEQVKETEADVEQTKEVEQAAITKSETSVCDQKTAITEATVTAESAEIIVENAATDLPIDVTIDAESHIANIKEQVYEKVAETSLIVVESSIALSTDQPQAQSQEETKAESTESNVSTACEKIDQSEKAETPVETSAPRNNSPSSAQRFVSKLTDSASKSRSAERSFSEAADHSLSESLTTASSSQPSAPALPRARAFGKAKFAAIDQIHGAMTRPLIYRVETTGEDSATFQPIKIVSYRKEQLTYDAPAGNEKQESQVVERKIVSPTVDSAPDAAVLSAQFDRKTNAVVLRESGATDAPILPGAVLLFNSLDALARALTYRINRETNTWMPTWTPQK